MEGWMWLVLASMFAVGGLLGYVLGRSKGDNHEKIRELESSLRDSKDELQTYRGDVAQHFGKTAELFNQLTTDYRAVYEHLAASSEALCGDQVPKISAKVPDKKLLDADPEKPTAETAPAQGEAKHVRTATAKPHRPAHRNDVREHLDGTRHRRALHSRKASGAFQPHHRMDAHRHRCGGRRHREPAHRGQP